MHGLEVNFNWACFGFFLVNVKSLIDKNLGRANQKGATIAYITLDSLLNSLELKIS